MKTTLLEAVSGPELLPEPGQYSAPQGEVRWDLEGIEVRAGEKVVFSAPASEPVTVQLSRSTRVVQPHWLKSMFGGDHKVEYRAHVELRTARKRFTLSAEAPEAWVKGLKELPKEGLMVPRETLVGVVGIVRALGGKIAHAGHEGRAGVVAVGPRPQTIDPDAYRKLADERDAAERERLSLEAALRREREARETLESEQAERESRAKSAEEVAAKLSRLQGEHDALRGKLKRAEKEAASARSEKVAVEQAHGALRAEVERLQAYVKQLLGEVEVRPMKTLDEHNRVLGLSLPEHLSGLQRSGVACPQCSLIHDEQVEMIRTAETAYGGIKKGEYAPNWGDPDGLEQPVTSCRARCVRCGYEGWMFERIASCNVVLEHPGESKLAVIRALRDGLRSDKTLAEIKAIVDTAPVTVATGLARDRAHRFAQQLQDAGGRARVETGGGGESRGQGERLDGMTRYRVVLQAVGPHKIQVIKEVRAITQLDLKAAKALVDSTPNTVTEGLEASETAVIRKRLEGAGATVVVEPGG